METVQEANASEWRPVGSEWENEWVTTWKAKASIEKQKAGRAVAKASVHGLLDGCTWRVEMVEERMKNDNKNPLCQYG